MGISVPWGVPNRPRFNAALNCCRAPICRDYDSEPERFTMFENLRIFRGLFLFARARDCPKICVIYRGNRIGVAVLCAVCVIGRTKLVGIVVQWSLRFLSQWLYRRGVSAYFLLLSRFCQCSNDAACAHRAECGKQQAVLEFRIEVCWKLCLETARSRQLGRR